MKIAQVISLIEFFISVKLLSKIPREHIELFTTIVDQCLMKSVVFLYTEI